MFIERFISANPYNNTIYKALYNREPRHIIKFIKRFISETTREEGKALLLLGVFCSCLTRCYKYQGNRSTEKLTEMFPLYYMRSDDVFSFLNSWYHMRSILLLEQPHNRVILKESASEAFVFPSDKCTFVGR